MPLSLMIKGTPAEADVALRARGFNPSDWLMPPRLTHGHHVASVAVVSDENEPGVIRWYAETDVTPPYPVGTLLHYQRVVPNDEPHRFVDETMPKNA